jgi:hypothetical protein
MCALILFIRINVKYGFVIYNDVVVIIIKNKYPNFMTSNSNIITKEIVQEELLILIALGFIRLAIEKVQKLSISNKCYISHVKPYVLWSFSCI